MAMDGIQALIDNGNFNHVQITTIVNREGELPELMLTLPDYHHLFEYIRNKRRQCGKHNGKR